MLIPCPTKALNKGLMLILALCTASSLFVQSAPVQLSQPQAVGKCKYDTGGKKQPSTLPPCLPSDPFTSYIHMEVVGPEKLGKPNIGRTIIVGDVHGRYDNFMTLMKTLEFDQAKDKVILAGDLVAKGEKSLELLDEAQKMGALCVRGNHDDEVLRWRGYLDSLKKNTTKPAKPETEVKAEDDAAVELPKSVPEDLIPGSEHEKLARKMTVAQFQYLSSCPLILSLPDTLSPRKAAVYVMHAGIDPALTFEEQKPWTLFNVRSILNRVPSRKTKGLSWSKLYNEAEAKKVKKTGELGRLVVYGHDAEPKLNNQRWSVGVDTGCVKGGQLSAYIVEEDKVVSIDCGKASNGGDGDD